MLKWKFYPILLPECDDTKCATCSNLINCILSCPVGCIKCDITGKCLEAEPGKYADPSGTVHGNI